MEKWETHVLCFFFLFRFPSHKVGGQIGVGFAQFLWTFVSKNAPISNLYLANSRAEKKIVHHRHLRRRRGENEEAAGFVIKKGERKREWPKRRRYLLLFSSPPLGFHAGAKNAVSDRFEPHVRTKKLEENRKQMRCF